MIGNPASFLDVAQCIGRALVREAYWDADHRLCNWVGRSTHEVTEVGGPITPTAAALAPGLYSGSSGVALFLAQLAGLVGDDEVRATAAAGMANALRNAERLSDDRIPALSFHSGLIGIAFAAHSVAALIREPDLGCGADRLLGRVIARADFPHIFDVIGGNAGAIPALLVLWRLLARQTLFDLAVALGDELLTKARRRDEIWAWNADETTGAGMATVLLPGMAHGAAGLGLSLLELHSTTGRADFLEAARGAFAYEDTFYDAEEGNWPDLRSPAPGIEATADSGRKFALAWCHGAPGIALARARAARLDPSQQQVHVAVARVALTTTLRAMDRAREHPRADATLCHGLAGLAEIAFCAGQALDDPQYGAAASNTARLLIERHAASEDWPSGLASGGPNPSLMIGIAGIGLHLLRQHAPEHVLSPLWVTF